MRLSQDANQRIKQSIKRVGTPQQRLLDCSAEQAGFRRALPEVSEPRYGRRELAEFIDSRPVYACIDPQRMFTCHIAEAA